ncbi:MAG: hypothetical protein CL770_04865 [Chloroflexi bacterium]|nr:hypothetical protein [Chloroflexota bacterium]|tara:strand:- start:5258 stop:6364 length:1107 start_codon:yes stop_codon:yes gene_type:complete
MKIANYELKRPDELETPVLIVYEHLVKKNISEILKIAGSPDKVIPHFKTHKSIQVLRMQIAAGFRSIKCATLREAEVLAENGVSEILIAYPMIHPKKLKRFINLINNFPDVTFKLIVGTPQHLEALSPALKSNNSQIGVYLDLDTGMRRTGIQPGKEALEMYSKISQYSNIIPLGVHVFDGQALYKPDLQERKNIVSETLNSIDQIWEHAQKNNLNISDNVVAGSWTFHLYPDRPNIRISPGTWIYWDSRNATMEELNFDVAAIVLGQVIDHDPQKDTITTDIGSKACSPDQPTEHRFKLIGYPNAIVTAQSEEHGVIKLNGEKISIGDYVLAAPGHACTAVVKYPYSLVSDPSGEIIGKYNHDARDH